MPRKNSIKQYLENGIYHIYNRGVNKQDIFLDEKDYKVFLHYLKFYLDDPKRLKDGLLQKGHSVFKKNFHDKIDLLSFCLMPNHFHLLVKQKGEKDISEFMKCLITNYSMYFNKRYEKAGALLEGRYKAVLILHDNYLLHLSRYIHTNPVSKGMVSFKDLLKYNYSSYADYLGKRNTLWVKPDFILGYFNENKNNRGINKSSYRSFVEDVDIDSKKILNNLILE